ncbi:MAG TPA: acyl-CoA dehydrogenase family protein [Mycobacteriales bacterium]|nr:acyl-CoA dehydrogenase family protein [Mycobacteriales bacterium]
MDLELNEEQQALRDSVRRFLEKRSSESEVRRLMATDRGYDEDTWHAMAAELGLQGLPITGQHGGSGAGWREVAVVMEEMGRSLACVPYLSTMLAAAALSESSATDADLSAIAAGDLIATVVFDGNLTVSDGRVNGSARFVLDGHVADLFVIAVRDSLHVVHSGDGVTAALRPTLDQTRKLADVTFADAAVTTIGSSDVVEHVRTLATVLLAAEQVGGAQRVMEMAADYARSRTQFGRPIGMFQGVKHKCADMLLAVESARAAAYYAAWVAAQQREDLSKAAHVAGAYCSDAYFRVAALNIQVHGGIGFTWEHPAHLYYRRAKSGQILFGTPAEHRAALADLLEV